MDTRHNDATVNNMRGSHDNPAFDHSDLDPVNNAANGTFRNETSNITENTENGCTTWLQHKTRSACSRKVLNRRFPILSWLPKYNSSSAVGDLVAGITVGLTVIPQSLAYANIAGLPAQYGLYGSFLGCFLYIFLGSCKDVPVGPTAIASLLTHQAIKDKGHEYATLLCLLTGIIHLVMAMFGLGFLIDFISGPVSSGFTSAVALIIVTSQVKDVLGIHMTGTTFLDMWISIFGEIHKTNLWDAVMGFCCIGVLLSMRYLTMVDTTSKGDTNTLTHTLKKCMWLTGTSRNAILVVVGGIIGFILEHDGQAPFALVGYIPPGLPDVTAPPFSVTGANNTTVTFFEMCSTLGTGIIVLPLLTILENIAICKAFADGKTVDATQELLAIGTANVASSFIQAFPITGSVSRSAVNNSSGVRSPLGGLYTGILVIIALLFFTPCFYYIPKASLAGIIIAAVVFMVEVRVVKPMWRTKKTDLIPGLTTFVACLLLPLEYGILVGISVNILFILYHAARPKIEIEVLQSTSGIEYLMVTPDRCLVFPSVDYVRNLVNKQSLKRGVPVVIDCSHIYGADYTAATAIGALIKDFTARGQTLLFYNLKPSVNTVFEGITSKEFVVCYDEQELDRHLRNSRNNNPV